MTNNKNTELFLPPTYDVRSHTRVGVLVKAATHTGELVGN